jgi:serine/threonine protein kinase
VGIGASAKVWVARHKPTGVVCAVKSLVKRRLVQTHQVENTRRECEVPPRGLGTSLNNLHEPPTEFGLPVGAGALRGARGQPISCRLSRLLPGLLCGGCSRGSGAGGRAGIGQRRAPERHQTTQDAKHIHLVLEYVPGGELYSLLRKYLKFSDSYAALCATPRPGRLLLERLSTRMCDFCAVSFERAGTRRRSCWRWLPSTRRAWCIGT